MPGKGYSRPAISKGDGTRRTPGRLNPWGGGKALQKLTRVPCPALQRLRSPPGLLGTSSGCDQKPLSVTSRISPDAELPYKRDPQGRPAPGLTETVASGSRLVWMLITPYLFVFLLLPVLEQEEEIN